MKSKFKNILFFLFFFSFLAQSAEKPQRVVNTQQNTNKSVIFQDTSSLLDIENNSGASGILQSLTLTERSFAGSHTIKIQKKQGFRNSVKKFFICSADYYKSYHSRRNNRLKSKQLYISIRSLII